MPLVDRIGLGLFVLVGLFMFFLGETGPNPKFLDAEWWQAYFAIMFAIGMKLVLPVWLALRFFDLVSGARARRRGRFIVRPFGP